MAEKALAKPEWIYRGCDGVTRANSTQLYTGITWDEWDVIDQADVLLDPFEGLITEYIEGH
jgi:hypothetical protein